MAPTALAYDLADGTEGSGLTDTSVWAHKLEMAHAAGIEVGMIDSDKAQDLPHN
jgi:hypothetical protein